MKLKSVILIVVGLFVVLSIARLTQIDNSTTLAGDHRHLYTGVKLLKKGVNPYLDSLQKNEWKDENGPGTVGMPYNPLIYPPFTVGIYTLIMPDTWQATTTFFKYLSAISLLLICLLIFFYAKIPWYYAIGILLSFKFIWYLVILTQPSLFVFLGCTIVLSLYANDFSVQKPVKEAIAGIFLGLAWLKPTLFLPLFLYLLIEKRWKPLLYSLWFPVLGSVLYLIYLPPEQILPSLNVFLDSVSTLQSNVMQPEAFFIGEMTLVIRPLVQWFHIPYDSISWIPPILCLAGIVFYFIGRKKIKNKYRLLFLFLLTWLTIYHPAYDVILLWIVYVFIQEDFPSHIEGILLLIAISVFVLPLPVKETCIYPITLTAVFAYLCYKIYRDRNTRVNDNPLF